jgi:hypothetical protein
MQCKRCVRADSGTVSDSGTLLESSQLEAEAGDTEEIRAARAMWTRWRSAAMGSTGGAKMAKMLRTKPTSMKT